MLKKSAEYSVEPEWKQAGLTDRPDVLVIRFVALLICSIAFSFWSYAGWSRLEIYGLRTPTTLRVHESPNGTGIKGLLRDEISWTNPRDAPYWIPVYSCLAIGLLGIVCVLSYRVRFVFKLMLMTITLIWASNVLTPLFWLSVFEPQPSVFANMIRYSPVHFAIHSTLCLVACWVLGWHSSKYSREQRI